MSSYDVVYVVRPGLQNEELRYSMRSVAQNLEHAAVWVVGACPDWVSDEVGWIQTRQIDHKHRNVRNNLLAACASSVPISSSFILMNDDFFVLRPTREVLPLHAGSLDEFAARHFKPGANQLNWGRRAAETSRTLQMLGLPADSLHCYELHVPMVIDRELAVSTYRAVEAIGRADVRYSMFRTRYGNLAQVGGQQTHDVKIWDDPGWERRRAQAGRWRYLSTGDTAFAYGRVGTWLRDRFPTPCKYEKE